MVKNPPTNEGEVKGTGLIPRSERSPGIGNGNPLQYSCLGKFHGQRNLVGYKSMGSQRVGHDWVTCTTMPTFRLFTLSSYLKFFIIGKFSNIAAA